MGLFGGPCFNVAYSTYYSNYFVLFQIIYDPLMH